MRWTTKTSSPGSWLSYPNIAGAIVLTEGGGAPSDAITNARGALSGSTLPVWDQPEPTDLRPTMLFTNGASLNSYANFGAVNSFMNLGFNTPMTLIARVFWVSGKGGIAERNVGGGGWGGSGEGWAWGVSSTNRLMFIKEQSLGTVTMEGPVMTASTWVTVAVTFEGEGTASNGGSIKNYINGVMTNIGGSSTGGGSTNLDDSTGGFRLGNSSRWMPGLGNPTMDGSWGGSIAWLLGFHRVLSADELLSFNYERNVPTALWERFTIPRRARYFPAATPSGGEFTIDGTPRDILQRWSISEQLNERGTMRFGVKSMDASYRPGLREVVDFNWIGIHFFAGHIHHTEEGALARVPYGVVPIETQCGATDFNALPDRRQVAITLPAGTLESMLVLVVAELAIYGVTLDPAQVTGPTIAEDVVLTLGPLTAVLNKLSVITGYAWNINYDKVLSMFAPGTEAAPFNIEDNDARVVGDVRVSPTTVNYGNHITVKWTVPAEKAYIFYILDANATDGSTGKVGSVTFTFKNTPVDPTDVQIGATTADTIASLAGVIDAASDEVDAGVQAADSVRVTAKLAGSAGNSIQTETNDPNGRWGVEGFGGVSSHLGNGSDPALTGTVVAEDVPAQDGGANLYELVFEEPTATSEATAQALADGYLVRSLVQPREIRYRTRLHGLHPGMQQQIQVTGRNVDGPCLITAVDISPEGSAKYSYDVTAVEGLIIVPSYQDGWRTLAGRVA